MMQVQWVMKYYALSSLELINLPPFRVAFNTSLDAYFVLEQNLRSGVVTWHVGELFTKVCLLYIKGLRYDSDFTAFYIKLCLIYLSAFIAWEIPE